MSQSIIRSQEKGIATEQYAQIMDPMALSVLWNVILFTTYERNSWSQFIVMRHVQRASQF